MYIIAQYASDGHWEHHYDIDPNLTGLHSVHSVHKTIEGNWVKPIYNVNEHEEAKEDCRILNNSFPSKGYAVVRVL